MNGIGAHEVVIESRTILQRSPPCGTCREDVLWGYRDRMLDLKNEQAFPLHSHFKNHGEAAGATIDHPHSQLIALPIVPRRVSRRGRQLLALLRRERTMHFLRHHPARSATPASA